MTHVEQAKCRVVIADFIASSHSVAEAMEEFSVSRSTIMSAAKAAGVTVDPVSVISYSTYRIIASLINTDYSYEHIAGERGITRQRVAQIADAAYEAGIKFLRRKQGGKRIRKEK